MKVKRKKAFVVNEQLDSIVELFFLTMVHAMVMRAKARGHDEDV